MTNSRETSTCSVNELQLARPFWERVELNRKVSRFGKETVRRTLIDEASRAGANVVSIAIAPNWLSEKKPPSADDRRPPGAPGTGSAA